MGIPRFTAESSVYRSAATYASMRAWGGDVPFSMHLTLNGYDCASGYISSDVSVQAAAYTTLRRRALTRPVNGGCPTRTFCCGGVDDTGRCNGDCCSRPENCCSDGSCCPSSERCCTAADGSPECSDLKTDPQNCGFCGHSCQGGTCSGGQCTNCPPGLTACGGSCVDVTTDPANCGTCGNDCSVGCDAPTCPCCSGTCSDLLFDDNNCGACGSPCPENTFCFLGGCVDPEATCQTFVGNCAGLFGGTQCVTAGGVTQCCGPGLFGNQPWVTTCTDGFVNAGCSDCPFG